MSKKENVKGLLEFYSFVPIKFDLSIFCIYTVCLLLIKRQLCCFKLLLQANSLFFLLDFPTYDIREQQVPPRDESPHLAHSHVAVEIGRSRLGHAGAEFSIAESGEDRGQSSNEKGDDDAGAGQRSGHLTRKYVDPGAQCAAHAESHQVHRTETPSERGLLTFGFERLPAGQTVQERTDLVPGHDLFLERESVICMVSHMNFCIVLYDQLYLDNTCYIINQSYIIRNCLFLIRGKQTHKHFSHLSGLK